MKFSKPLGALAVLVLAAASASAQTRPETFTVTATTSPCPTIRASNNSVVGIVTTGTWSGTFSPTVKIYGATTGIAKKVTPLDGSAQTTITTNGGFTSAIGGFTEFDLCPTSWVSGTATVQLYATPAVNVGLLNNGATGTISGVTAGSGLTGGGTSGSVTVSLASTLCANGPVFGNTTASLVGECQEIDVGSNSTVTGTGLDGKINAVCMGSYTVPGVVPIINAKGYPAGSTVLSLTNPFDNCNRTFELELGNYTIAMCVPWITPHVPHNIDGVNNNQQATPTGGTVLRAGTTSDGCPTNFPGAGGAVLNWTASGYLGAVFPHGPFNWYTTTGGYNNSGTYAVAMIYEGAMTQNAGANSLDWTLSSFGARISNLVINPNGLANFCMYTASEEEHQALHDIICNGPGIQNGIVVTQVTNGSATVSGTFPYPNLLQGQSITLNGTAAVVQSATTSALTLVGTFSGTTSSSVTFAWAGTTAEVFFDRMGNNGCAGTQTASGGVVTCTSTGTGGSNTQSGPGNSWIDALQSAQYAAYPGVVSGTAFGLVYIGYGIEIYITDASGSGTGARAYTTVAISGVLNAPVVSYGGTGYAAAGGGGTTCAIYSPMSNNAAGLTCTPTVAAGIVTAVTLGGTNTGWSVGANSVTGPLITRGWGEAGDNTNAKPSFLIDYLIAGVSTWSLLQKQCQGINGTVAFGPLGPSCVQIGDGNAYTYGGTVDGVQSANEYGAGLGPAVVHIAADLDAQLGLRDINQQATSNGRPIIFDDRYNPSTDIKSATNCEGVAYYTLSMYEQCGQLTFQNPGVLSAAAQTFTGAVFTGGSGTTTVPFQYFNQAPASAPTTWSTSGTYFGINAASGFAGNFFDYRINGGSSLAFLTSGAQLNLGLASSVTGQLKLYSSGNTGSTVLQMSPGSASAVVNVPNATGTVWHSATNNTTVAAAIFNMSAATGTAAFLVPTNTTNTASAASVIDFDSTNKNYHGFVNGADSIFLNVAAAPTTNVIPKYVVATGNTLMGSSSCSDNGTIFSCTEPISAGGGGSLFGPIANSTAVTVSNPTAATDTIMMAISLPANYLNTVNQTYHIVAGGILTTTTASVPLVTITPKICSVAGCASGTVTPLAAIQSSALSTTAVANATWLEELDLIVAANGASCNFIVKGKLVIDTAATVVNTADSVFTDSNTAASSPNQTCTNALFLDFFVQQSTTGASNSYKQLAGLIR